MYVKNLSAHLITVNTAGEKPVRIPPGGKESVKVKSSQFIESLIARGDLVETAAPKGEPEVEEVVDQPAKLPVTTPDQVDEQSVDELRAQLDGLGVQYDKRWGIDRLQKEVDAALDK